MDIAQGSRVGSKNHRWMEMDSSYMNPLSYEAKITDLFVPWLIDEVPDGAWSTLQEKLGRIVRDIISGNKK